MKSKPPPPPLFRGRFFTQADVLINAERGGATDDLFFFFVNKSDNATDRHNLNHTVGPAKLGISNEASNELPTSLLCHRNKTAT